MIYEIILTVGIKGLIESGLEVELSKSFFSRVFDKKEKRKKKEVQAVFKLTPGAGFLPSYPLMLRVWNEYVRELSLDNGYITIKNGCFVSTINLHVLADAKTRGVSFVHEAKAQLKEEVATRLKSQGAFELIEMRVVDD